MVTLKGKCAFGGVGIGRLSFWKKEESTIKRYHIEDVDRELVRLHEANIQAAKELKGLYDKASAEMGEGEAQIFEVHRMMLEDPDYQESVINIIKSQRVNAEYAVGTTGDNFAQMFSAMDDVYFKERAADVKDISERLVRILTIGEAGTPEEAKREGSMNRGQNTSSEPVIVAAEDLAPSETVQMDKERVLAFVTRKGSVNSHTAIIARTLNIPAIVDVGAALLEEYDGKTVIVDGQEGTVYIEPDEATKARMRKKQAADMEKKRLLQELKGKETITADGRKIHLYANIGNVADAALALENDAEGIGLFRSEFLYLENQDYPTEEQQFRVYKTMAEIMAGRRVIIRTLDIGADKKIGYFDLPEEENPAMGFRAIRICLERPWVLQTQLRAIMRASAFGRLAVMFPMITSLEEVRDIKRMLEGVRQELRDAEIPFDEHMEIGIMIETPAAVMISDLLAKEVDFFSVGTNDLTQYTLAVDRQNPMLDRFYNAHHPAIVRMLELLAKNAHANGIWVGICGELGADPELLDTFLAIGIDELSVSPAMILPVRDAVRKKGHK